MDLFIDRVSAQARLWPNYLASRDSERDLLRVGKTTPTVLRGMSCIALAGWRPLNSRRPSVSWPLPLRIVDPSPLFIFLIFPFLFFCLFSIKFLFSQRRNRAHTAHKAHIQALNNPVFSQNVSKDGHRHVRAPFGALRLPAVRTCQ